MTPLWEDPSEPDELMLSYWVSRGKHTQLMAAAMLKDISVFELVQEYVDEGLRRESLALPVAA